MGNSTSARQVGAKYSRLARELKDSRGALNEAGMAGRQIFLGQAAPAGVLGKQVAGRRKIIGARYDVKPPRATVTYTGPAHLVNNPTSAHWIFPRGARSRRRGALALTIEGNVRASAFHRGTRGKHFYEKARAICVRTLPGVFARAQITQPLQRIF